MEKAREGPVGITDLIVSVLKRRAQPGLATRWEERCQKEFWGADPSL